MHTSGFIEEVKRDPQPLSDSQLWGGEGTNLSITQKLRGRAVTHDEAAASCQRLINSHFHNPDSARMQIPVSAADDDVIVSDYIKEQREKEPPR